MERSGRSEENFKAAANFTMNTVPLIHSPILNSIPGLVHGYTTRDWRDMRDMGNRDVTLRQFHLSHKNLVWAKQIHGDTIHQVTTGDRGHEIYGVDALISAHAPSRVVLAVYVADCVPLLFVDPVAKILAVAHAGWRGTLAHLPGKVVRNMMKLGAHPKDIFVGLGPHIAASCYDVPPERAILFAKEFKQSVGSVKAKKYYLNLSLANSIDLMDVGVPEDHIDISTSCTHCHPELFSYRRDNKETFGNMLGFITYAN